MRHYYSVDAIRDAEAPLLASLPDGALMRRAAYGLATAIIRELTARTGGVAGRRLCAVVGSGDNGGDALWAATFLRRRGAAADAVLLNPERTHRKALAAFRRSRRPRRAKVSRPQPISSSTGWWASPARVRCGRRRPRCSPPSLTTGIPVVAVDIPSGVDVATGAITGPRVHAALTVTFGGLKPVHALADCGRVELDRHRAGPAGDRRAGFRGRRRGRALAGTRPARRQVHPGRHRGDGRLVDVPGCGGAVHRCRRRGHLRHGPLRG